MQKYGFDPCQGAEIPHASWPKNQNIKSRSNIVTNSIVCFLFSHSCPTVCDPLDYGPPDSSVHGISQARILEWTVISFNKDFKKWLTVKKKEEEEEAPEA